MAVVRLGRNFSISAAQLCTTLVGQTTRQRPCERTDRLQSLAQAHVVGENGSETRIAQKAQPVDAAALVLAQLALNPSGKRNDLERLKVGEQWLETIEAHGPRLAHAFGKLGERRASQRVAARPRLRD